MSETHALCKPRFARNIDKPNHQMTQSEFRRSLRALTTIALLTATVSLLSGCGGSSYLHPDQRNAADRNSDPGAYMVKLDEPAADEVAIVINNNAGFGTHAGMFVGEHLSDPAGNYAMARRGEPGWERPTLRDYVEHQMVDGLRVQIFRFKLESADIKIISARVANSGITVPLNCAVEIRNEVANVGLFKALKPTGWLSPNELAEQLLPMIEGENAAGTCVWPDGRPCRPVVNATVARP